MNVIKGIKERLLFQKKTQAGWSPPPPCSAYASIRCRLHKQYKTIVEGVGHCQRVSMSQFVASRRTGRLRKIYGKALDSLRIEPLTRLDSHTSAFVKAENVNVSNKYDPAPRIINPRDPRYNINVGCYLYDLEHKAYESVNDMFGHPTIAKGMTLDNVAHLMNEKWQMFSDPVALGIDAHRFDQHVSVEMLRWEHSIYNKCYDHCPGLKKLLSWQLENHGKVRCKDGNCKFTVKGRRMSGDMNTSLGNCIIASSLVHCLYQELGIEGHLMNNGDDCVLFFEKHNLEKVQSYLPGFFLDFGFTMEVEDPCYVLEKVEFCQMHPVFDGVNWRMVRNPNVCLDKDLSSYSDKVGQKRYKSWAAAVGLGGSMIMGGIPILHEWYKTIQRDFGGGDLKDLDRRSWMTEFGEIDHSDMAISPECRASYYRAFGITPREQMVMEIEIRCLHMSTSTEVSQSRDLVKPVFRQFFLNKLDSHSFPPDTLFNVIPKYVICNGQEDLHKPAG